MRSIKTAGHTVLVGSDTIEYEGDEDITMGLESRRRYTLRITYDEYIFDEKIMSFSVDSDPRGQYGHLKHLYIPESIQGMGLGRLSIAIFYSLLRSNGFDRFSMKFGGGGNSYGFLRRLGFSDEHLHTHQNTRIQGDSVIVGDFESLGLRHDQWNLDPIFISEFPTGFFN